MQLKKQGFRDGEANFAGETRPRSGSGEFARPFGEIPVKSVKFLGIPPLLSFGHRARCV